MFRRAFVAAGAMLQLVALITRTNAQDSAPKTDPASSENGIGDAEKAYAEQTGRAGSASLLQSRMAVTMATDGKVRMFAMWEVAEQETIGDILKSMTVDANAAQGALMPPSDEEAFALIDEPGKAKLDQLQAMAGAEFDEAYVTANLEGHKTLLAVQEEYLTTGTNREHLSIAKLARSMVTEHIVHLEELLSTAA